MTMHTAPRKENAMPYYLIALIPIAVLAYAGWRSLRRLWRAIPNSNRDFSLE